MNSSGSDVAKLVAAAMDARKRAYCPYSKFAVGAALVSHSGEIFLGANVENVSFGLTMCAERVAIGTALQAGETSFTSIAIAADATKPAVPCGACRQVLAEFSPKLRVIISNMDGATEEFSLESLLPLPAQGILG